MDRELFEDVLEDTECIDMLFENLEVVEEFKGPFEKWKDASKLSKIFKEYDNNRKLYKKGKISKNKFISVIKKTLIDVDKIENEIESKYHRVLNVFALNNLTISIREIRHRCNTDLKNLK